jgi:hypothetical protein
MERELENDKLKPTTTRTRRAFHNSGFQKANHAMDGGGKT